MRKLGRTVEVGAIANIENEIPLTIKLGWVKVKAGIIDLNTAKVNLFPSNLELRIRGFSQITSVSYRQIAMRTLGIYSNIV